MVEGVASEAEPILGDRPAWHQVEGRGVLQGKGPQLQVCEGMDEGDPLKTKA